MCGNLAEGLYYGWFLDNNKTIKYNSPELYLSFVNKGKIKIGPSSAYVNWYQSPSITISGCHVMGTMGATFEGQLKMLDIIGEITKEKKNYVISGSYTYTNSSGDPGNPNKKNWKVHGTFEIKSPVFVTATP